MIMKRTFIAMLAKLVEFEWRCDTCGVIIGKFKSLKDAEIAIDKHALLIHNIVPSEK